jgi:hypothetical protein
MPSNPRTPNSNQGMALLPIPSRNPRTPVQQVLGLQIQKLREIDGIGMGVLTDGTAFLTGRGLARLCGVDSSRISEIAAEWDAPAPKSVAAKVKKILQNRGVSAPEHPYIEIKEDGGFFHAYSDVVCLAVLEYYAFDALKEQALNSYRVLAGKALHDFIYAHLGYDPNHNLPERWAQFHARVSLTHNAVPVGYFSIFKEIADMIVTLGEAGLHIDSTFVPDISVGGAWGKHWADKNLEEQYGERVKWEHNYPEIFPQAKSNPQHAWCYPEAALPEFRRWFREGYVGDGKLSRYINGKIKANELPPSFTQKITKAYDLDGEGALRRSLPPNSSSAA